MSNFCFVAQIIALLLALSPAWAQAASKTIEAGQTLTLTEDMVLAGDDSLVISGTADKHVSVVGKSFRITTKDKWAGKIKISFCDFKDLGTDKAEAMKINMDGKADVAIDNSVFDACGAIYLNTGGESTVQFRNNTLMENCLVPAARIREQSRASFQAEGGGTGAKVFAGNRVYKCINIFSGRNWTIGGDKDEDSNFLIGTRCGLTLSGRNCRVAMNYIHTLYENGSSQVANIEAGQGENQVIENNVLHQGEWVVRSLTGELRNNVILDMNGHNWVIGPRANAKIHHNIFARYVTWDKNKNAGISVCYDQPGIEIYNNTFDGRGKDKSFDVPVLEIPGTQENVTVNEGGTTTRKSAFVERSVTSFRNNVMYNFCIRYPAVSVGTYTEKPSATSKPARMGYADYNCFSYDPNSPVKQNYAVSVAGKTERKDAGFAANDLPKGGKVDEQVDPKFAGPIPEDFPWKDAEMKAGKVKVSQMLDLYRKAYAPAKDSPLIDAGDPADGEGTDIGAVDAGKTAKPKPTSAPADKPAKNE